MFLPQYSPQGLMGQFPIAGAPVPGLPQFSPFLFGQPSPYGLNGSVGYGFAPSPASVVSPFASPFTANPIGFAGATHPIQTIVPLLGQLAQQFSVQGIVNQQLATVLQHLAQQVFSFQLLAQSQPFIGAGQFGLGTPMLGSPISQYFTPGQYLPPGVLTSSVFGTPQVPYGFTPQQAQSWGASRAQTTIQ